MADIENLNELKEAIRHRPALTISRLDDKAKERFIALANEEFCSDYGMTIKALMERCDYNENLKNVLDAIYDLDQRIDKLEKTKSNGKMIKLLDGKEIGVN